MSYRYTYVDLTKDRKEVVPDLLTQRTAPSSPPLLSFDHSDVVTIAKSPPVINLVSTEHIEFVPVLELDGEICVSPHIVIESPRSPPVNAEDGILTLFAHLAARDDCPEDVRFLMERHINGGESATVVDAMLMDGIEEDPDTTILQMDAVVPVPLSEFVKRSPDNLVCVNQPMVSIEPPPRPRSSLVSATSIVLAPELAAEEKAQFDLVTNLGTVKIAADGPMTPTAPRATQTGDDSLPTKFDQLRDVFERKNEGYMRSVKKSVSLAWDVLAWDGSADVPPVAAEETQSRPELVERDVPASILSVVNNQENVDPTESVGASAVDETVIQPEHVPQEPLVESTIVDSTALRDFRINFLAMTALVRMQKRIKGRYQKQKDDLINSLGL